MRFMLFIHPGLPFSTEENSIPSREAIEAMSRYNRQLHEAGVLLDVNGLHSPNEAVRISFPVGKPQVVDGPFAETKELVAGYLGRRRAGGDRGGLEDRVPPPHRRSSRYRTSRPSSGRHAWSATSGWPRSWPRTPSSPPSSSGRRTALPSGRAPG